tara:strand:- start:1092 stop:2027 length:936 start_codon:yes stop_codon:yes gene_type:complete
MNILVTGGAGFIGSHLVDCLLDRGNTVTCIDNLSLGSKENLQQAFLYSKKFKFIEVDMLNVENLEHIFQTNNFEMVYHLVANSDISTGTDDPSIDLGNTFQTTFNVLECMRNYSVSKLFFPSTSAIYGDTKNLISENTPRNPCSLYGAAKLASESYISAYCYLYGIKAWTLRLSNIVGPRSTHGVIYDFIKKLKNTPDELKVLGDGNQNKPYIHIEELVQCIIYICENSNNLLNDYNVAPKDTATVKQIAELVVSEFSPNASIAYEKKEIGWAGDVTYYNYDTSKISALGWNTSSSSFEAIKKAVKDIKKS